LAASHAWEEWEVLSKKRLMVIFGFSIGGGGKKGGEKEKEGRSVSHLRKTRERVPSVHVERRRKKGCKYQGKGGGGEGRKAKPYAKERKEQRHIEKTRT